MSAEPMSTQLEDSEAWSARARRLVTPEGVELTLEVAPAIRRAVAFCFDVCLVLALAVAVALVGMMALASAGEEGGWFGAFMILGLFVLRNFYFTFFELYWRGQTPGKRFLKLRVVDASGGVLSAGAIFVRNLTREMELFLPLTVLFASEQFWPGAPGAAIVFATCWTMLLGLMPLLNRDRLRVGDLIAGTMVVDAPEAVLLEEVGAQARTGREAFFEFTHDQLDMYGIYELQVLEDFLRGYPGDHALVAVGEKITRKIAWLDERWQKNPRRFLEDFYEALRGRREQRMLFGDRQESKKEGHLDRPEAPVIHGAKAPGAPAPDGSEQAWKIKEDEGPIPSVFRPSAPRGHEAPPSGGAPADAGRRAAGSASCRAGGGPGSRGLAELSRLSVGRARSLLVGLHREHGLDGLEHGDLVQGSPRRAWR